MDKHIERLKSNLSEKEWSVDMQNLTMKNATLYQVACTMGGDLSGVTVESTFLTEGNQIIVTAKNLSGRCSGRYIYQVRVMG